MAVSGKTAAPDEIPYYLGTDKPPDMAAVTKAMADRIAARLIARATPIKWYTPKVIGVPAEPKEETLTSTTFKTMAENGAGGTADEITGVVVPENGLIVISYSALVKASVSTAGAAAIFINANQLKLAGNTVPVAAEASGINTSFVGISASSTGLSKETGTSYVTTGLTLPGQCVVQRLAAGTYAISVKYKASSGSITAKERVLQVEVHGV